MDVLLAKARKGELPAMRKVSAFALLALGLGDLAVLALAGYTWVTWGGSRVLGMPQPLLWGLAMGAASVSVYLTHTGWAPRAATGESTPSWASGMVWLATWVTSELVALLFGRPGMVLASGIATGAMLILTIPLAQGVLMTRRDLREGTLRHGD
jgi:hypothetical protein